MSIKIVARLTVLAIALMVGVLATPAAASGSPGAKSAAPHPLVKQIDWSHPISLATLLKGRSTAVHPDAGIGIESVCAGGTGSAYPISYGGQETWSSTWHNLTIAVQYLYCPGGSVGYNFAFGNAYTNSGDTYVVRFGADWNFTYDGASLHSPTGSSTCNGKYYSPAYICDEQGYTGPYISRGSNYTDYSYPGPGNLQWSAQFWVYACIHPNGACTTMSVASPTF